MKKIKIRPEYSIINIPVLMLIYTLLCVLTVLFSRNFFINTLQDGKVPDQLNLIVFFTIPIVLMIVLGISGFNLLSDIVSRRSGSRFNARLLAYFAIIVIFSVTPLTVMTSTALNEVVRFWQSIDSNSATRAANSLAADNYSLHMERFENIIRQTDFSRITRLPSGISSVQVFRFRDGHWTESSFMGNEQFKLAFPPSVEGGFTTREIPQDLETIRYVQRASLNTLRLISYDLGS
ncbi:MAG: sensor histidine kinase, partial [Treponema sp.]|nr:sensor histidine kinase [Treponema sp.]